MWLVWPIATVTAMPTIALPKPRLESSYSVEAALANRRSVRSFSDAPISLAELGQLLWAAQGITSDEGYRTAPSAGALYPLEIYAMVGNVDGLAPGIYKYTPRDHSLKTWRSEDRRAALAAAAYDQASVMDNAVVIVLCAVPARTARKYGERSTRYIFMEVGHSAQNVFLQAQSLGLAAVVVGAFSDEAAERVLELPERESLLYLMPVGLATGVGPD